ncbi:MAG: HNH endonuclease [Endomicrobia bacterium]|nr:HNH endonuclease [Endomicrobiia bacterium]MCX7716747.1 HNH endonuclease [Endomicrobiia bacterium]
MSHVLVLNKHFVAINVTSWRRAIKLVYLDHADVVDEEYKTYSFKDWFELSQLIKEHPAGFISTPKFKIAIPEVIALKRYDKIQFEEPRLTRRNIYEHYGYRCCYCGKKFPSEKLNIDHIIPRSRGGKTEWNNIVTSCTECNFKKGNKTPQEAKMTLVIPPSKPHRRVKLALVLNSNIKIPTSWQKFVDNLYWNVELEK